MSPGESTQEEKPSDRTNANSTQQTNTVSQAVPTTPIVNPPPPPRRKYISCYPKKARRDCIKFFAELVGLVFLIAYTTFAALQWCTTRDQLKQYERPWIALAQENGLEIEPGSEPKSKSVYPKDDRHVAVVLDYRLRNTGHTPAFIQIEGKFVDDSSPDQRSKLIPGAIANMAQEQCAAARARFPENRLTVVPDILGLDGMHYDGDYKDAVAQHRPIVEVDPDTTIDQGRINKYHQMVYVGCIAYQATIGDKTIHQTPFDAFVHIRMADPNSSTTTGPWMLGTAD
jgi:hypothetical protein